jgi:hypothetical protein
MISLISPQCCTMECQFPTACHTISTSIVPFPFLKFYSISVITIGRLEYIWPNQKPHSVMQGTRKMNLVQVLFDQASYTLHGRNPQRQQSHADKSGDLAGNRTSSLHFLQNFHWVSCSVWVADPSCWISKFWTNNQVHFFYVTVTVMLSSSQNKRGTITTQHTASYHCQIFTVKRSMVEWNSILQSNWSSAYLYTEREVCFVWHMMKTNSPPSKM